jgi:hypothetical protein
MDPAGPFHHLLALKLRAGEDRWHADDILNQAIERFRGGTMKSCWH